MIKSSGLGERKGTPSQVLPAGDYLLECVSCVAKESRDEANDYVKGTNVNFRFVVEDALQPTNENWIGSTFFESVFIMSEEHPKYETPLKNDPTGRTIGDLGPDQLADIARAMGIELDDEIEDENETFAGQRVIARIRQRTDNETGEVRNAVRKWMSAKGAPSSDEEDAPKPKAKAPVKKRR